ncbi:MAG: O-antigen ligase family protein [Chloracidobacterium sp.]|nr:O-antigen ligase family protein [Chloracidobacterium sp.]
MNDSHENKRSIYAENVIIGNKSSRVSSAIFVLLCIVPIFSTILFGAVDKVTWVFITMFGAVIVLLWLAEAWKGKGFLLAPSAMQIPMIGLLLIGIIQLLPLGSVSVELGIPASRALSLDPYATRFFLLHLVIYIVFFASCLTFINNESRLKKTFLMVIIFGAAMAFFGILQRLANPDGIYGLRATPQAIPFGPFVNQHHFASFMEMTAGLTIGLLFGKRTAKGKKILLAIALVVMLSAIVLTSSRGGVLGIISVTAFAVLINFFSGRWSKDKRSTSEGSSIQQKVAVAAVAIALIFVVFGLVLFLGGNDSLVRGLGVTNIQDGVSNGRSHFWAIAVRIFFEHPILGAGLEAFGMAFTKHDTWSGQFRVEQAHNEYLQMLADAGIAGFLCVATFIYFLFRQGLKTISNAHGMRRDVAIGALAGCFGILIHSFFDFPMRTPSNAFFFLLLCALATVSIKTNHSETSRRRRSTTALSQ